MYTQDIPISELPKFFRGFSQTHRFEYVSVDTTEPSGQKHANAKHLTFVGVLSEPCTTGGGIDLSIIAGTLDAQVTHKIHQPTQVRIVKWRDRLAVALEIKDVGGYETLIRLEPPND